MSEDLQLLNPAEVRKNHEIKIDIGEGKMVLARKLDMTTIVFEGAVPMVMLNAVQRMIDLPKGTAPAERIEALGEQGKEMVSLLRRHAVMVVTNPKLTLDETDSPDRLPVSYLHIGQLMAIWTATAVVPHFGTSQAARFRELAGINDVAPAPAGDSVQPGAELVADRPVATVSQ